MKMYAKYGVIYLVALVLVLSIFFFASFAEQDNPEIFVEYIHGGLHGGRRDTDWEIARQLAEQITRDETRGKALSVNLATLKFGLVKIPLLGHLSKSDIVAGEEKDLPNIPDNGILIKVGYSSGGGALWDLVAVRNVDDKTAGEWVSFLDRLSEKRVTLDVVLVDAFTKFKQKMGADDKENVAEFLRNPQHRILGVHFGKWSLVETDSWLKPDTDFTYGQMRTTFEYIRQPKRFQLFDPDSDTSSFWSGTNPLGSFSHGDIGKSIPFLSTAIRHSIGLPPLNQPPAFSPTSLSEKKTVYYSVVGGRYLIMSPSWEHIRCLTVTDPDGDDLSIRLGSSPRYGMANVFSSRTGPGTYNVTVSYQISPQVLKEIHQSRDDRVDSFDIVAANPVHRS